MNEYILFMHDDIVDADIANDENLWTLYMSKLRASDQFDGGSAIGQGLTVKRGLPDKTSTVTVTGYIRVRAQDFEDAKKFLVGNPSYDAGGTVEVRELPSA